MGLSAALLRNREAASGMLVATVRSYAFLTFPLTACQAHAFEMVLAL